MKTISTAVGRVLACMAFWLLAAPAFAAATSWSGSLASPDPTWNRVGNACGAPVGNFEWFDVQRFTVDANGSYTIAMTSMTGTISPDGYFALYATSFDPDAAQANCLTTADDGIGLAPTMNVNLQAGITYVLVTTQCCDGTAPGEEINYTNTISGPGTPRLFDNFALDIDGNGAIGSLTDGLLLLRWELGLRGASLISGAVGAGATRNTAPAIEAYLAGLRAQTGPIMPSVTAAVGGTGGGAYARSCAAGSVAVGLVAKQGTIEPPNIGSVTIACAPMTFGVLGGATVSPVTTSLAPIGTGNGASASLSCAAGSVITGIQGSTKLVFGGFATVVENLTLQCSPLGPGAMALVGPAGAGNTTPFDLRCPVGAAMRGLQGSADQLLDAMQIQCQ